MTDTDTEEMQRRQRACEMVGDMVRAVYAGKPSSKGFVPRTISASALVSKKAEEIASDLIDAHLLHESNVLPPWTGNYFSFWGDMASTRVLEGPEVNADAAEFHVTLDLGNGWCISAHPDGAKIVEVDGRRYVVMLEQKNWARTSDHKKKVIALRQAALYLAMCRELVRRAQVEPGWDRREIVFGVDPNYERPAKPLWWQPGTVAAGVVRSICSPQPPGDVYSVALSDERLDEHLIEMREKALHIMAAVESGDLDFARKWDSDHPGEFRATEETPDALEAKTLLSEYVQINDAIKQLEARKAELRDPILQLAQNNGGRADFDGFSVKLQVAKNPDKIDKTALQRDGLLEKYLIAGGTQERLVVSGPQEGGE